MEADRKGLSLFVSKQEDIDEKREHAFMAINFKMDFRILGG